LGGEVREFRKAGRIWVFRRAAVAMKGCGRNSRSLKGILKARPPAPELGEVSSHQTRRQRRRPHDAHPTGLTKDKGESRTCRATPRILPLTMFAMIVANKGVPGSGLGSTLWALYEGEGGKRGVVRAEGKRRCAEGYRAASTIEGNFAGWVERQTLNVRSHLKKYGCKFW